MQSKSWKRRLTDLSNKMSNKKQIGEGNMAKECNNTSCTKEDCSNCKSKQDGGIPKEELNDFSKIGKVIGVVSGKGGVGKSFVQLVQI